ncbi:MAG: molybdate ABC transporter substrate-binding protein [Defluviitaleaceae bacterium]|nr:molybdate ABC transporter substrate-binding protein [Defluviitaleaceae bacterium]
MKLTRFTSIGLAAVLTLAVLTACAQPPAQTAAPAAQPAAPPAPAEPAPTPEPTPPAPEPVELLIGAAMSLRDVVEELSEMYQEQYQHVTLLHTFASSGALQGQIEEGAPIDIFMSAAAAQMRNLEEQDLIYGTGRNLVTNTVALIVPAAADIAIESFEDVALDAVGIVGLGDPEAMPIGRFAQEVFTALGVADEVYDKAVLASDVRQILTWVEMGEVDAGVVFMTDAITSDEVRVIEAADPALHSPSLNPVGIVGASPHIGEAQNFVDFLFSDTARAVFESHGFSMYE